MAGSLILGLLIQGLFFGFICSALAGRKGYNGYFAVGFFFSLVGLIYVGFLPSILDSKAPKLSDGEVANNLIADILELQNK